MIEVRIPATLPVRLRAVTVPAAALVLAAGLAACSAENAQAEPAAEAAQGLTTPEGKPVSEMSREDLGAFVRNFLMENPEVILQAVTEFQMRQEELAEQRTAERAVALLPEIKASEHAIVEGNPEAQIVVVEFFDYQCGFCRRAAPAVLDLVRERNDVKTVFIETPVLGPESTTAARASLAAREQGKWLEFHSEMMASTDRVSMESILAAAEAADLDLDRLQADMESAAVEEALAEHIGFARAIGVEGTPSFLVGDTFLGGWSQERFQALLEEAEADAKAG